VPFSRHAAPYSPLSTLPGQASAVLVTSPGDGCCFRFWSKHLFTIWVNVLFKNIYNVPGDRHLCPPAQGRWSKSRKACFCGVVYSFLLTPRFLLQKNVYGYDPGVAQTRRQFYMLPLLLYYEFCQLLLSAVLLFWGKNGCMRGVETGVRPPRRSLLIHL